VDLLEYQGKSLLARLGVPVPDGGEAGTPEEARAVAARLDGPVVVKAQVPVGGRGKAGGIRAASDPDAAAAVAGDILGMDIRGHTVDLVRVERASEVADEYYASFTLDRSAKQHLAMVSAQGGVDIEKVAADTPEAVVRMHVDPVLGLTNWQATELVYRAGFARDTAREAAAALHRLYEAFVTLDCDLVEVNPLVRTGAGAIVALDAKVTLDSNAFYRHPDFEALRAAAPGDPLEARAREHGLNFIKLDGSVGIIGNGAGLVMSTLDLVSLVGGAAANFLDAGGGAGADTITDGLEVLTHDPDVGVVLINIFGGIVRCDQVAEGIVAAIEGIDLPWPIVVRLDGTNAEEGRAILDAAESDLIVPAPTMRQAAERAVQIAAGA
jgi:succinyl-CoA synthetase beta subunit